MSEGSLPIGDLLNSLMEHPEMLQKAMGIASSLASSGILNELIKTPAEASASTPSSDALHDNAPASTSPNVSINDLLSGLLGNSGRPPEGGDRQQPRLPEREEKESHPPSHPSPPRVGHTERIRLLQSLRPFLPSDKQEKIDFVIKLLGLLEAAERMGLGRLF